MTKMSDAQRVAILRSEARRGAQGGWIFAPEPTVTVLIRNGWAMRDPSINGHNVARATRAGLIAAGLDMDAIHAEALDEDAERYQGVRVEAAPHGGWHVFLPSGICVAWRTNSELAQALVEARTHAEAMVRAALQRMA